MTIGAVPLPDQIIDRKTRSVHHILAADGSFGICQISFSSNHVHEDRPGDKHRFVERQHAIADEIVKRWNAHTDLLEFLRFITADTAPGENGFVSICINNKTVEDAHAAIAKATGGA